MQSNFTLFDATHLTILAAIPFTAAVAGAAMRRRPAAARWIRYAMGGALAMNELIWWTYRYSTEGNRFPEGLPLQLCDVTLWLTVAATLRLKQWPFEFAYFTGLAGTGMATLTPDLWAPWPSYPSIYFFVAHGLILACVLMLCWGRQMRPRQGCLWHVFVVLNGYALFAGVFNWMFGTNYMYLRQKPRGASILDFLGPWPWYVATGELVAFALFVLLWLPWRVSKYRES